MAIPTKIVSGGQTGADRAALDWAIARGILHGGWCPKGRRAEDGVIQAKYELLETPSSDYVQRTEWNVRDSDGTVVFSIAERLSGGSKKTVDLARKLTGDINGRQKEHTGSGFDEECDSVEKFLVSLDGQSGTATANFLAATVLKAPHHGSNGSSSLPFIREVAPAWVVFCAGHEYNHPDPGALRRYGLAGVPASHLLRTDEGDSTPEDESPKDKNGDGSYLFETDGTSITQILRLKVN